MKSPTHYPIILSIFLLFIVTFTQSCSELEAKEHAEKGKSELLNCNFKSAHYHFDQAHSLYPSHKEILTGLAISELAYYADSEEMRELLEQLGFDSNLQTWCLNQTDNASTPSGDSEETACKTFELRDLVDSDTSSPDDADNAIDTSHISSNLTWDHILEMLLAHQDILRNAAGHFATIAEKTELDSPFTTDFAGSTDIPLHQADFAAISSALYLLSALLEILDSYTWNFSVKDTIDAFRDENDDFLVQALNQNLLYSSTRDSSSHIHEDILSALKALKTAVQAVEYIKQKADSDEWNELNQDGCAKRHSLFHWENMHYGILRDFTKASHIADESNDILDLNSFFDPGTAFNLEHFSSNLPTRTANHDVLELQDNSWSWMLGDELHQLNQSFTPAIFDENSSQISLQSEFDYRLNSAWLKWRIKSIL